MKGGSAILTLGNAVDLFVGEMARQGKAARTRDDYRRKLYAFCDANEHKLLDEISADDCRRFLDRWVNSAPGTMAHSVTVLTRFFGWLHDDGRLEVSPMDRIRRPRLLSAEELDVVSVSTQDVQRMIEACLSWQELLCICLLAYLGPRRRALSQLRRRDLDFDAMTVTFREKGGKTIAKPVPLELLDALVAADEAGLWPSPLDYLVPMVRGQRRDGERDDRIIWRIVRKVAARVGVTSTVHALRAAFAVHYLESKPGDLEALQALMGHRKLSTTQVYLRKLDRDKAMERVRDLSWGAPARPRQYEALPVEATSGFEPLYDANRELMPLRRKLAELKARAVRAETLA